MTIDFGEANKQKTPDGYEECHAIIGFDRDGMLRISETNEEWEPDDCERSFYVGNVQRVVFYHKVEPRQLLPIRYFIMDNYSRDVRKFYHYDETLKVEELPHTEPEYVMGYGFYNGATPFPTFPTSVDNTGDYIPVEESEPQKTADSLLSEILKRPMKTIFDKD